MKKLTMSIDEAIVALQNAKEELKDCSDIPSLILVLPDHGLATNVVDLVANKEDGSVRVIVRLSEDKTNSAADLMYKRGNRDGLFGLNANSTSAEYIEGWQEGRRKRIEDEIRYGRTPNDHE